MAVDLLSSDYCGVIGRDNALLPLRTRRNGSAQVQQVRGVPDGFECDIGQAPCLGDSRAKWK